jgi:hypothetical protein
MGLSAKHSLIQAFLNLSTGAASRDSSSGTGPICVVHDRETLLCEGLWSALQNQQHFLNYGWLANTEKISKGARKIRSLEGSVCTFELKTSSVDLQSCTVSKLLGRAICRLGKNFCVKSIMTCPVNPGYGTSCAWRAQKVVEAVCRRCARMARDMPSASPFSNIESWSLRTVMRQGLP